MNACNLKIKDCSTEYSILDVSIGNIAIKIEPIIKNSNITEAFFKIYER